MIELVIRKEVDLWSHCLGISVNRTFEIQRERM